MNYEESWRELFAKYIKTVINREGVTFVDDWEWPPEELDAINTLLDEKGI